MGRGGGALDGGRPEDRGEGREGERGKSTCGWVGRWGLRTKGHLKRLKDGKKEWRLERGSQGVVSG